MLSQVLTAAPSPALAAALAGLSPAARALFQTCRRFEGQCVGYSTLNLEAGLHGSRGEDALTECERADLVRYTSAAHPLEVLTTPDPAYCFWSRFPA